jgi:hypothetical protein
MAHGRRHSFGHKLDASNGTLAFDVYGQAGTASKTLNPPKDPDKKQENLDKAVAKLLKNFPPPKKVVRLFGEKSTNLELGASHE